MVQRYETLSRHTIRHSPNTYLLSSEYYYVNKYKRVIFELTGTTISVAEIVKNDFSVTKQHGARSFNSVWLDS